MLNVHEVIPPLTARLPTGDAIRAWDFKQKKNLVIAFLHSDCKACGSFLEQLALRALELAEAETVALAIFSKSPWSRILSPLPREILAAADTTGRSQLAYLEENVLGPAGQQRVGVFITDRYGELYAQWVGWEPESLPQADEVFVWLAQVEMACEEDGVSHWTAAA